MISLFHVITKVLVSGNESNMSKERKWENNITCHQRINAFLFNLFIVFINKVGKEVETSLDNAMSTQSGCNWDKLQNS